MATASKTSSPLAEPRHLLLYPTMHLSQVMSSTSMNLKSKTKTVSAPSATSQADPLPQIPRRFHQCRRSQAFLPLQTQALNQRQTLPRKSLNLAVPEAYSFRVALLQLTTQTNSNANCAPAESHLPAGASSTSTSTATRDRINVWNQLANIEELLRKGTWIATKPPHITSIDKINPDSSTTALIRDANGVQNEAQMGFLGKTARKDMSTINIRDRTPQQYKQEYNKTLERRGGSY